MKKLNLLFFLVLGTILTIMSVSLIFGAVTVVSPVENAIIGGNITMNVSGTALVNCTFYLRSSSVNQTDWVKVGDFKNTSNSNGSVLGSYITSRAIEDSNNYEFNATCKNNTDVFHEGTRTGITIDNTIPTAPVSLSPINRNTLSSSSTQTFSATVNDNETTGCTYTIYRGGGTSDGTSGTATYSTTSCSFTKAFTTSNDNGLWLWTITASDGSNTSISNAELQVNLPGSGGGLPGTPTTDNQADCISKGYSWSNGVCYQVVGGNPYPIISNQIMWIGALIILIFIVIFVFNKVK